MIEDSLYDEVLLPINGIYDIFKDYFGKEYVDLQNIVPKEVIETITSESMKEARKIEDIRYLLNLAINRGENPPCIIVHFPIVKVENEFNKFTYVNDLWVKVNLNYKGFLLEKFQINRSTYSYEQFMSDYQHSHTPGINYHDYTRWSSPCTGRGPINNTIASLSNTNNPTLWQLFCVELDKYVHVESIQGVPYRRLESIGKGTVNAISDSSIYIDKYIFTRGSMESQNILLEFIKYYINNYEVKVGYRNKVYILGDSLTNFIIKFSNAFIKWFNEYSCGNKTSIKTNIEITYMTKCIYSNDKLYYQNIHTTYKNPITAENSLVLIFKGKEIKLHIASDIKETDNLITVFQPSLVCYIIDKLLDVININYGRE